MNRLAASILALLLALAVAAGCRVDTEPTMHEPGLPPDEAGPLQPTETPRPAAEKPPPSP
jgi:hypothetical protein